ncbi:unnamed protein product [Tetraodon nigroviridis]|uniref:(spotted green pufferfish) hypothetical protein n=1 Tax=Tetraodon nigroviridis TaxID=99883 RepID=Q4RQ28_TETNG|nr:unnamed protein product [Tetraodon nigroviridis]
MSSHEMRGAANAAGFHINSAVLQTIVSRHADAQYAIDFDSFVGCLIKLEMLFSECRHTHRCSFRVCRVFRAVHQHLCFLPRNVHVPGKRWLRKN